MTLTLDRLKQVLDYDPSTGVFRWKVTLSSCRPRGTVAGYIDDWGYRSITIDGFAYKASRLAWFYQNGAWPPNLIDHWDGVTTNDKFDNLRLATIEQNAKNKKIPANNNSGVTGVFWEKSRGKWTAFISIGKKQKTIGRFNTKADAIAARKAAETEHYGEFARVA